MKDFDEFKETPDFQEWNHEFKEAEESMFGKRIFLLICQVLLLVFLWIEIVYGERGENFFVPPADLKIVICRFLCAIFLHITLLDDFAQDFKMMKYALNHPWKFKSWSRAFVIGLEQMAVAVATEVVSLAFSLALVTIVDVVSYFVSLLVISQFAQYFFLTVNKTLMGELLTDGKVKCGRATLDIEELTKLEATTSENVKEDEMIPKFFKKVEGEEILAKDKKSEMIGDYEDKDRKVRIKWNDRDWLNLFLRLVYWTMTGSYKVFWFYFAPFIAFILSYWLPFQAGNYAGTRTHI